MAVVDLSAAGAVAGAVATGATGGDGGGLWAAGGSVLATGGGAEPCRAMAPVTEFEALFQAGDAQIQPVAIAVERIDGGGKPPRLAVGFPGNLLDLLRLPAQIGGGDLVALEPKRRLVGHHGQNHRARGAGAPGSDPPQRAAVEPVLVGQQLAQHATGVIGLEVPEMVWFPGQAPSALLKAPAESQAKH